MDFTLLLAMLSTLPILGSCCGSHYVEVGSRCLLLEPSLTLDHRTSEEFCNYLDGRIAKIDQPQQLLDIVQHIDSNLTLYVSYWVDGKEVDGKWVHNDGSIIPSGTPFWATYIDDNQHYQQQPVHVEGDNCLAIKKEESYYFTSNPCADLHSPLCEEITGTSSGMSASSSSSSSCGGALTAFSGVIRSPGYPNPYPQPSYCIWTITRPEGSVIRLTLEDFDTWGDGTTYLSIRDGPDDNSPELGHYYGHDVSTPITLITSGRQAWVDFSGAANYGYRGFRLSWTTEQEVDCHIDYNLTSGVIQSPWYSDDMYPPNLNCVWTITVDEGSFISLTVVSFDTEKDKDIVQIRDGADKNAPLLIEMSDRVEQGLEVQSSSNHLFLSFTSDDVNDDNKGFVFVWTTTEICPSPYLNVGRMCLHFIFTDLTFGQSGLSCQMESGQLAAISDPNDLRDLYVFMQNQGIDDTSFWLGGTDDTDEGLWKWKDESLVPRGTPFWGTTGKNSEVQEPDGGETENCLLLRAEGFHYFRDAHCDTKAKAICMHLKQ